jgi:hypothetical protein
LEVFAKDELGLDENQVKGVVLVSDAVTSGTVANPTYSVYWINPDNPADIKLVINDDTGGAIRYSPNVEAIKTRERAREIEAAKEKSDLEYMLRLPSIDLLNRYDGRTEN